jgi:hypothetical protein
MASADEKAWQVEAEGRAYGLHVILLKREYVLPWAQFLYAEGTGDEVQAVFSTHDIVVRGADLSSLLSDLAEQRVTALKEPVRADKFTRGAGPHIREVEVRRVESEAAE